MAEGPVVHLLGFIAGLAADREDGWKSVDSTDTIDPFLCAIDCSPGAGILDGHYSTFGGIAPDLAADLEWELAEEGEPVEQGEELECVVHGLSLKVVCSSCEVDGFQSRDCLCLRESTWWHRPKENLGSRQAQLSSDVNLTTTKKAQIDSSTSNTIKLFYGRWKMRQSGLDNERQKVVNLHDSVAGQSMMVTFLRRSSGCRTKVGVALGTHSSATMQR